MKWKDVRNLFLLSFFLMLTIGESDIILHRPSTFLELSLALTRGIVIASAFFLAPLAILYYAQKKKLNLTIAVALAVSIEFFWAVLAKILGYAQYSRDFLIAGIIGTPAIPIVYIMKVEKEGALKILLIGGEL